MVIDNLAISFEKNIDGNKLKPFLNKKFIVIPKKMEEVYYKKFITQIVASFDVYAQGFEIETISYDPKPVIVLQELAELQTTLFDSSKDDDHAGKMVLSFSFEYGSQMYPAEKLVPVNVTLKKQDDQYTFTRIKRDNNRERDMINLARSTGLFANSSKMTMPKSTALQWISTHFGLLQENGFELRQKFEKKKFFLGTPSIKIEVTENIDWFDIHAIITFGEYQISFKNLRKFISKGQTEFTLPNGETAIIPESWITEYSHLLSFTEEDANERLILKKHHISILQEFEGGLSAHVSISKKLKGLSNFEEIEDYPMPEGFVGELRPYQKAGYNWLRFLEEYRFGGCLADDMGLGKTVQTLALLQATAAANPGMASLLVMPTSLIYNWEMEAARFSPQLRLLNYTGSDRDKNEANFANYDLVITSYGITRIDIDMFAKYKFNYVILDESQAIKNPDSIIAKAVLELKSKNKLILSGTPVENSTMDLWSQMNFINPGLLGGQRFFRNEFLIPIEKKKSDHKMAKLYSLIKPFILRRDKSQVAKDLPEKVENVKYCNMTPDQEEIYEQTKASIRNKILKEIEEGNSSKNYILLLQGLTLLRQMANHPVLADTDYASDSGKFDDIKHMLLNALGKGHKILVFSQFVKHLTLVSAFLKEQKITFAYLDGSTKDRKSEVERFQNDDDYNIFLISLKAGGVGLNLTKADYVFILDPWWNPAAENQAIDRAHRIGQQNKVFTYKFITKNTVEEKILKLQASKLKLAKELISTEENFMKSLSKEDISSLLD
jgi:SNF2 family DNA or RNA helicase